MSEKTVDNILNSAGVMRRLAALIYDTLLMLAIAFVVTNVYLMIFNAVAGLTPTPINPTLLQTTLFPVIVIANSLFLLWFWIHGGRTLGMRAWHLRIVTPKGQPISLRQAVIRLVAAPLSLLTLGLGYWSCWVDPLGCTWHDRFSGTRVILDRQRR